MIDQRAIAQSESLALGMQARMRPALPLPISRESVARTVHRHLQPRVWIKVMDGRRSSVSVGCQQKSPAQCRLSPVLWLIRT
jgi:hypothetical protein